MQSSADIVSYAILKGLKTSLYSDFSEGIRVWKEPFHEKFLKQNAKELGL
ncbi:MULTISPECIES: hypothetical protein [Leptospira]|uniref:Uncharacterized protein n=1 Tax=Leptospira borgpetersenii serovar Ballum TaxID=280505 RepID=A0A0S2IVN2_LEPBO|nr:MULTISPECIES: hypothetical protein [Leptospira]ANH01958.1 Uncharacterized protein LB4E_2759 [Leptospira borgpetersenii str. 4E]ALO27705.1 hypothetical protein LBBP_03516 [Leptospira borgpetersenii serovar Ballum]MBE8161738.1 hypothetical protein [Leptospira borgpetersenii serovar Ballum]MBE8177991.1 hypothetical protein [Leptospira borgpetersenii serovar Ballum]MBE8197546.1 hypothetical protein [Leptospira borgpetersenii serovar Ballum]